MLFRKSYIYLICFILSIASPILAQNTTVSGTVTDPDSFNWAGGTIQFAIYNPAGGTVTSNGVPLTASQSNPNFTMNGSGVFSGSVLDNTLLKPVGTLWDMSVCPAASSPCQSLQRVTISGASQSLTSTINSQIKHLRFPASYTARAYGSVEISPIPPSGGTYYDITLGGPKYWNGTAWIAYSNTGSVSPHAPTNSIQTANAALDGFNSDPAFQIDATTHTRSSTGNDIVNAYSSISRAVYDPMDTKYLGGLAAAVNGTSGHTATEVINAALDDAFCQTKTTRAKSGWVITPPWIVNADGIKLWPQQKLGGESMAEETFFGHTPLTQPMIALHAFTDTITCNGTVYTPGGGNNDEISYIAISGSFTGAQDIGIKTDGTSYIHDIQGWGQAFGQQAIWIGGVSSYGTRLGLPGSQISGCQDYTRGISTGICYAVQMDNLDGNADYIYASDGATSLTGKGPGSCYPNCGAIGLNGAGTVANNLFAQLSDIGIVVNGTQVKGNNWRIDATSMEGVRFSDSSGGTGVFDIKATAPCLSTSLQAAFNAETATGCYGVLSTNSTGGGNLALDIQAGGLAFFGSSYMQCIVGDDAIGGAGVSNTWGLPLYQGFPGNTTSNNWAICTALGSAATSARGLFYNAGTPVLASTATINISGITSLWLANGLTATNFVGGIAGQKILISASPTATSTSIDVTGNFKSCNGLPTVVTNNNPIETVVNGFTNKLDMLCNPPNLTPTHINYFGNPTPSNPSFLSVYGNVQALQVPVLTNSANQLHGPAVGSGHYCFIEEIVYPDASHNDTPQFCTTTDLTNQTAGEIFVAAAPQSIANNLYLSENTTGSSLSLGKIAASSGGFWDGPTKIAAGGDGSPVPVAGENTTGSGYLGFGVRGPVSAPSGSCSSAQGGTTVISQDGHGTFCPLSGGTWTSKW